MDSGRCIIELHEVVARHPDYRMSGPVSLSLMEGEQLAIVGGNGAGKSLLVDLITGAHPIVTDGRGAFVKYDFGRDSQMVCDNVKYITFKDAYGGTDGNYYYQIRFNQTEFDDRQRLFLLSSGELRRHQLTQALSTNPRVLILDNPFIGLDVQARREFDGLLTELVSETDTQVVIVLSKTDDMPEFVTHVVEVKERRVGEKMTREAYLQTREAVPAKVIGQDVEDAILGLPEDAESASIEPGTQQVIDFDGVTIRYGERTILQGLDFTVMNGEHWALTGENGAGKSTLLSIVCADNPQAYANNIVLFGHRRGSGESIWDIKRHIGYISPEMHRAFLRDYPAIEVVASGLHDAVGLYKRPRPEQIGVCRFWMRVFGVEKYADTSFLKLSSGEQRLVLLARAFVKDPSLLILDEPLHGLDMWNRQLVKDVIETFCRRRNKTLIMVTHYEDEFPSCIDHRIFLRKVKNEN